MNGSILWIILYLANGDISSWHFDAHTPSACEKLLLGAEKDMAFRQQKGRVICLPRDDFEIIPNYGEK
jgi:hypothetical protein